MTTPANPKKTGLPKRTVVVATLADVARLRRKVERVFWLFSAAVVALCGACAGLFYYRDFDAGAIWFLLPPAAVVLLTAFTIRRNFLLSLDQAARQLQQAGPAAKSPTSPPDDDENRRRLHISRLQ